MSGFQVPIIRIGEVRRHGNADTLSITTVQGEDVVFRTGDFMSGELAVYVPVEAVVPTTVPGTEFLGEDARHRRIKAKRLRGVYSEGLLLPPNVLPDDYSDHLAEGDDVKDILGIIKHEDTAPAMMGGGPRGKHGPVETIKPPVEVEEFNIDPFKANKWKLRNSDEIVVTEKLHGTQVRYLFHDGQLHVGSHRVFWKNDRRVWARVRNLWRRIIGKSVYPANLYWKVARELALHRLTGKPAAVGHAP